MAGNITTNVTLRFVKRYINLEQCIVLSRMECDYKIVKEIKNYLDLEENKYQNKNIDVLDHIPSSNFSSLSSYLAKKFIQPLYNHFHTNPYQTDIIYLQNLIDQQKLDKDFTISKTKCSESHEDYDPYVAHSNFKRYIMKDLDGTPITNLVDFYQNEINKIQSIKACYKIKYDCKELEHFLISYSNRPDHYLTISNHELVLTPDTSNLKVLSSTSQHIIEKSY